MLELLGLTPEQIAEGESWDPKKGKRTKDLGDRIGDGIMSLLTGTNYGQRVQEATRNQYVDTMTDAYGSRIDDVVGLTGYSDIGDLSKLTDRKIEQELLKREKTKAARSKAAALTGEDVSEFSGKTDPGEILAHASRLTKEEGETKEKEARERQETETRRLEGRSEDRLAMTMELNRLDRKDEREARRDQLALENRRLDMQEARTNRRDRQAAIQQMMAGLAQLGASIAI